MNNVTFVEAMKRTTAKEKGEFEAIKLYLGLKQAETANHIINQYLGKAISAYYQDLKRLDPNFKKWLIQQGE
ncbi:hypothetical protein [Ursidibacter arcticus]